jgi:Rrf2 family protein
MKLTHATGYALTALAHLARNAEGLPVASQDIAREHGLPEKYLVKVLSPLAAAGILRVVRGPSGGYRLNRPLKEVTLLEVVEAVEGPVRGRAGAVDGRGSGGVNRRLQAVCDKVAGVVRDGFRKVRVRDLLDRRKGR